MARLPRRCIDCSALARSTRCPPCQRRKRAVRNADRPIAKAVVAAQPWCSHCGATEDLTADHVLAIANGGSNHGPRQTLCRRCNSSKGARR